jgi:chemotaxis protein histidine kinase CheA
LQPTQTQTAHQQTQQAQLLAQQQAQQAQLLAQQQAQQAQQLAQQQAQQVAAQQVAAQQAQQVAAQAQLLAQQQAQQVAAQQAQQVAAQAQLLAQQQAQQLAQQQAQAQTQQAVRQRTHLARQNRYRIWDTSDDTISTFDPRNPVSVAQYYDRYHITATSQKFAQLMSTFPSTDLLKPSDVGSLGAIVHIKHHLAHVLQNSVLNEARFSPRGQWARELFRQKFFFDQLTTNPQYYIRDAEFWKAADQSLRYVPIAPPELIADIINTIDPRKILDTNVMFGSTIAALAIAKPQSAMYDGLCQASARFGLESLIMNASMRPTFSARINLITGSFSTWTPSKDMYDMIISEIRTCNSEVIAGEPPSSDSTDINTYLADRIDPLLAKIRVAMTSSGTAVFLLSSSNPDMTEIMKHASSSFKVKDTKVSGQYTAFICESRSSRT